MGWKTQDQEGDRYPGNQWKDGENERIVTGCRNVVYDYQGNVYCYCMKTGKRHALAYGGLYAAQPKLYLTILAYVLLAPRMKDYSLIIAMLPTLHAISAMARHRWQSVVGAVLLWIPLFNYQSLLLAALTFMLVLHWIWRHRHEPDRRIELILNPLRGFLGGASVTGQ